MKYICVKDNKEKLRRIPPMKQEKKGYPMIQWCRSCMREAQEKKEREYMKLGIAKARTPDWLAPLYPESYD